MSFSDVSSATNYFTTAYEGFATTANGQVSAGATTITLQSVSGLTDASKITFTIEPGETNEQTFTGTVDTGNTRITDVVWTRGANVTHATGSSIIAQDTGTDHNLLTTGILKEHLQTGAHGAVTATSANVSGTVVATGLDVNGNGDVSGTLAVHGIMTLSAAVRPASATTDSGATITPTADATGFYAVTALATGATIAAPSGTPVNGQNLVLRIKDDGTARALAWNAVYRAVGVTLPTTTVISKLTYVAMKYNTADSKWDVLSVAQEA